MDLALAIENLVPSAEYGGSTTANTEEAFNALLWEDERTKPTWQEIQSAWIVVQNKNQKVADFNAAVASGYPVPGESYTLPLTTEYQDALNRAKNAFEVAELPDEYLVAIDDISNESHMVSVAKFREILKGYTIYYLGLRAQLKS